MMNWAIVLLVIPFCVGWVGEILKKSVLGEKPWKPDSFNWGQKVYFHTLMWHPVLVGLLLWAAFQGFAWPQIFGDNPLAYASAAGLSAGMTIIGYQLIVRTLRRMAGAAGAAVAGGALDSEEGEGPGDKP